jgi:hypothetical protein
MEINNRSKYNNMYFRFISMFFVLLNVTFDYSLSHFYILHSFFGFSLLFVNSGKTIFPFSIGHNPTCLSMSQLIVRSLLRKTRFSQDLT